MSFKLKIVAGLLGLVLVLGAFGVSNNAQAQTVDELMALIAQLQAQLQALQGGGAPTGACTFTRSLTVGSSGADVTCLQNYLMSAGFSIPAGATGYFGSQTQAAVAAWQAANGVSPAAGFFGPVSQARYATVAGSSGSGSGSGSGSLPAGCMPGDAFSRTTGQPCTVQQPGGLPSGITTIGQEGIMSVRLNAEPSGGLVLREGDTNKAMLGIEIEARNSDLAVQRVRLDLGTQTAIYNRYIRSIALYDGNTRLAEAQFPGAVVKSGDDYVVDLLGFNVIVPMGSKKVLTVRADAYSSIDSNWVSGQTNHTNAFRQVRLRNNGVRAVDGAGINLEEGSTSISRSFTVEKATTENAEIVFSTHANNPRVGEVVASSGANNDERDHVPFLRFSARAEKDAIEVIDLRVDFAKTGAGTATATAAYLRANGNIIASADIDSTTGQAKFTDIDYVIPKDATVDFLVDAHIRSANNTASVITASLNTSANTTIENSIGDSAQITGTVSGNSQTVRKIGPEFSLSSRTITRGMIGSGDVSTSTAQGSFNLTVTARGADITFGPQSASSTFGFNIFKDGSSTTVLSASSTSFSIPSGTVTSGHPSGSFTLQQNNSVTIPIDFIFQGRKASGGGLIDFGSYAIGLDSVIWFHGTTNGIGGTGVTSNFMTGETDWRTTTLQMP